MKMTLLQMTQNILSAMNSDQVNSISDTVESMQVAEAIKTTYMNMLGRYELPEHNQFFQLQSLGDPTRPCIMKFPDGATRAEDLWYFDTNPLDANNIQSDQFGAYAHDLNVDLQQTTATLSVISTTSNTIGTGVKSWNVGTGLPIVLGSTLSAQVNGTASLNSMTGMVTGYASGVVSINVLQTTGAGTYSVWTISANGIPSTGPGYTRIKLMTVDEFVDYTGSFDVTQNDVSTQVLTMYENDNNWQGNFSFNYQLDTTPRHAAIVANRYIIFDGIDLTQDATLQTSKTMCWGWVYPYWIHSDNFIPDLDQQQWPLFLNDSKALAFYEIKNQEHVKAEKEVAQQLIAVQKWKAIANKPTYFEELPDFGRRSWGLRRKFKQW